MTTISRLVNAFFRWEFNSCETLVKSGQTYPIDYANASPDIALVSLHYYFPWGDRGPRGLDSRDLTYAEKLKRYRELADAHFQADEFEEFRATALRDLDELVVDYVESPEFDALVVRTMTSEEPPEKQEALIGRSRAHVRARAADQRAAAR